MTMRLHDLVYRLARAHKVPLATIPAFTGRIKMFQRMGWPEGTNVGRGKSLGWSNQAFDDLAIVIELCGLSIQPEKAISFAKENLALLREAALKGQSVTISFPSSYGGAGTSSKILLDFSDVAASRDGNEPTL